MVYKIVEIVTLSLAMLMFTSGIALSGDSATLVVVDTNKAGEIWLKLVESRNNLDIKGNSKLVLRVPAVEKGPSISLEAAATASIIRFYEGRGDGKLSGKTQDIAIDIRRVLQKDPTFKRVSSARQRARARALWGIIGKRYNEDMLTAFRQLNSKAIAEKEKYVRKSDGEYMAKVLQNYMDASKETDPFIKASAAMTEFSKARDLNVTIDQSASEWTWCKEVLSRDKPLILQNDGETELWYVCVGYLENQEGRYLVALDPAKCRTRRRQVEDIKRKAAQMLIGADADQLYKSVKGIATMIGDFTTTATEVAIPGTVVLKVGKGKLNCIFVYNFKRNETMLSTSIKRAYLKNEEDRIAQPKR